MLNLLKADLYRITRPQMLRGEFYGYALALLAITILAVGFFWFTGTQFYHDTLAEDPSDIIAASEYLPFMTTPSIYLGQLFVVGSFFSLIASFGVVEVMFGDLNGGYLKTIATTMRGRLAFVLERVLFAGVWTGIMLAIGAAFGLACLYAFGFSLSAVEDPGLLALWFAEVWLITWSVAVIPLGLALGTRVKPVSYFFAFAVATSSFSALLEGLIHSNGGLLRVLAPLAPAFRELAAWMPGTVCRALGETGSAALMEPANGMLAGVLPGGFATQCVLVALLWIALGTAFACLVMRRRDA